MFLVNGQRTIRSRKGHVKRQVDVIRIKVSLHRKDVLCRSEWIIGLNHITTRLR